MTIIRGVDDWPVALLLSSDEPVPDDGGSEKDILLCGIYWPLSSHAIPIPIVVGGIVGPCTMTRLPSAGRYCDDDLILTFYSADVTTCDGVGRAVRCVATDVYLPRTTPLPETTHSRPT